MDMRTGDTFDISKAEESLRKKFEAQTPLSGATAAKVGFRELSPQESDMVRDCRKVGEFIQSQLDLMKASGSCDGRWLAIAQTHFQEGLMAAVRAVTKPAFF